MKELQINLNNHSLGTLVFTGREYRFTYEATWVSSGFPLCPSLPLQSDTFIAKKLFPVFVDASPGSWGQRLLQYIESLYAEIEKRTPCILHPMDILERTNNSVRQGAIESSPQKTFSLQADCENLLQKCLAIEEGNIDPETVFAFIRNHIGSGGARPKFNMIHDGQLWLCKCASSEDRITEQGWEAVNLMLAKACGLNVPPFHYDPSLKLLSVQRFDRERELTIPYISAATMLGKTEGSYKELATYCLPEDLQELFGRICLNMLVANFDDHLQNHGFLYKDHVWHLSPLFDVQSILESVRFPFHATGVLPEDARSDLTLLIRQAEYFGMSLDQAGELVQKCYDTVLLNWKAFASEYELPDTEIAAMASVYERHILPHLPVQAL